MISCAETSGPALFCQFHLSGWDRTSAIELYRDNDPSSGEDFETQLLRIHFDANTRIWVSSLNGGDVLNVFFVENRFVKSGKRALRKYERFLWRLFARVVFNIGLNVGVVLPNVQDCDCPVIPNYARPRMVDFNRSICAFRVNTEIRRRKVEAYEKDVVKVFGKVEVEKPSCHKYESPQNQPVVFAEEIESDILKLDGMDQFCISCVHSDKRGPLVPTSWFHFKSPVKVTFRNGQGEGTSICSGGTVFWNLKMASLAAIKDVSRDEKLTCSVFIENASIT